MERPVGDVQIWDDWNLKYRLGRLDDPSKRRLIEIGTAMSDLKIRDARILEVGCGTGWLSAKLSEFGKVTAIDIGQKIIEIAQANYPHIDFRSGDVETLDLPVNSFDVIVTSEVLSHVVDQPVFVHRLAQLLKPGHQNTQRRRHVVRKLPRPWSKPETPISAFRLPSISEP